MRLEAAVSAAHCAKQQGFSYHALTCHRMEVAAKYEMMLQPWSCLRQSMGHMQNTWCLQSKKSDRKEQRSYNTMELLLLFDTDNSDF